MSRFTKNERLCSRKQIESLLAEGDVNFVFPFKIYYKFTDFHKDVPASPCQLVISVPKRRIKKAVRRNLTKRRTREAFRINKQGLYAILVKQQKQLQLLLHYVYEEPLPYAQVEDAIRKLAYKLALIASESLSYSSGDK
jgi:ribonuclease P protein component